MTRNFIAEKEYLLRDPSFIDFSFLDMLDLK